MAPQRIRNLFDDSRSESSSTREKQSDFGVSGISKARRNGPSILPGSQLKEVTNAQSRNVQQATQDAVATVCRALAIQIRTEF